MALVNEIGKRVDELIDLVGLRPEFRKKSDSFRKDTANVWDWLRH